MSECSSCLFFLDGRCHRYPPRVWRVNSVWPRVEPDDFCGEWQRAKTPDLGGRACYSHGYRPAGECPRCATGDFIPEPAGAVGPLSHLTTPGEPT